MTPENAIRVKHVHTVRSIYWLTNKQWNDTNENQTRLARLPGQFVPNGVAEHRPRWP